MRILAAIDFSPASVSVIAAAVALARACAGAIEVLFVVPYAHPSRTGPRRPPEGVSSAVTEDVEGLLEPARAAGIPVRVCLKVGDPAREIEDEIRRTTPDLVILGTHGRGGFRRRALGSVATAVLRGAPCPVVTISQRRGAAPAEGAADGVVCAVALGDTSAVTIAYAADLAAAIGGRLTLVHVAEPSRRERLEAAARLHAAATVALAHGLAPSRIEERVAAGRIAPRILQAAARRSPAFLVVGASRSGAVAGSTTDLVVRGARWPVVTVPATQETRAVPPVPQFLRPRGPAVPA